MTDIAVGAANVNDNANEYSQQEFVIKQALDKINTLTLVKVVECTNSGELSPVGFVDVSVLVGMVSGDGADVAHDVIYNIPYLRIQGGSDAIIIDPKKGDIGICGFCSRDISGVKAKKDYAPPHTKRRHDYSDGLYFGGVLNGQPTQYIRHSEDGIELVSPTKIFIKAPNKPMEPGKRLPI